jgi:hypothetical protein
MKRLLTVLGLLSLLSGCGVYTFSGSTLPGHLNSLDIPLFDNRSLEPSVAELITEAVAREVETTNLLRIVVNDGDATLTGTVTSYSNHPYTYGVEGFRDVDVSEYAVKIRVSVQFFDNITNESLYKGTVYGEGIYDFNEENEETGRQRAIDDIVEQIIQNSVQSW